MYMQEDDLGIFDARKIETKGGVRYAKSKTDSRQSDFDVGCAV